MLRQNKLLVFLSLMLIMAFAQATEISESTGEENFERFCAACHGESAKGDGPVASAIFTKVPDLTLIAARRDGKFPRQMITNIIDGRARIDAHGTQSMPVWGYEFWVTESAGDFSDETVDAILAELVDYLESIQVPAEPTD
jgi:mono/diheme cytochrome c family protein